MASSRSIRRYYDRNATRLERRKLASALDREETDSILESLAPAPHSLLDVGCGTGHLLDSSKADLRVGVDFSLSMLNLAKGRGSECDYILADGRRLPFKEGVFQAVTCQDVIGHFRDPAPLVREVLRVCGASGLVLLTATKSSLFHSLVSLYSRIWLRVFVRSYTSKELEKIFEVSGASTVAKKVVGDSILKLLVTPQTKPQGSNWR